MYPCRDGDILIAIQNDREWASFCVCVLEEPSLETDRRFATNILRVENRASLEAVIRAAFASRGVGALAETLRAAGIAFGRLNDVAGLAQHPQLRLASVETASGEIDVIAPPAESSAQHGALGRVPGIGEHTDAVRDEFLGASRAKGFDLLKHDR